MGTVRNVGKTPDGITVLLDIDPHPELDPAKAMMEELRKNVAMGFGGLQAASESPDALKTLRASTAGLRTNLAELDQLIAKLPAAWMNRYREDQARLLREGRDSVSGELASLEAALRSCVASEKTAPARERPRAQRTWRRLWDEAIESRISFFGFGLNLKKAAAILKESWDSRRR